jgi:hypothetical protein
VPLEPPELPDAPELVLPRVAELVELDPVEFEPVAFVPPNKEPLLALPCANTEFITKVETANEAIIATTAIIFNFVIIVIYIVQHGLLQMKSFFLKTINISLSPTEKKQTN